MGSGGSNPPFGIQEKKIRVLLRETEKEIKSPGKNFS